MSWVCPSCGVVANLQAGDVTEGHSSVVVRNAPSDKGIRVAWQAICCPGTACKQVVFKVDAQYGHVHKNMQGTPYVVPNDTVRPVGSGTFLFEPRVGVPLSRHVPDAVREDYEEAHMIKDLSPKAAATLCRRALQGMVRDRWSVKGRTLHEEIQKIEANCDPDLYRALMGIKFIGNIGAHPEQDINLIVDVETGEVDALLKVITILDDEWYVSRAARQTRLEAVHALHTAKDEGRAASAMASLAPPSLP